MHQLKTSGNRRNLCGNGKSSAPTWWSTKSGCLAAIAHSRLWHEAADRCDHGLYGRRDGHGQINGYLLGNSAIVPCDPCHTVETLPKRIETLQGDRQGAARLRLIHNPVNPRPKFEISVSKVSAAVPRAVSFMTWVEEASPMQLTRCRWRPVVTRDLFRRFACGQAAVDLYAFDVLAGGAWAGHTRGL
jgi:hypothetical protein